MSSSTRWRGAVPADAALPSPGVFASMGRADVRAKHSDANGPADAVIISWPMRSTDDAYAPLAMSVRGGGDRLDIEPVSPLRWRGSRCKARGRTDF